MIEGGNRSLPMSFQLRRMGKSGKRGMIESWKTYGQDSRPIPPSGIIQALSLYPRPHRSSRHFKVLADRFPAPSVCAWVSLSVLCRLGASRRKRSEFGSFLRTV